MVEEGGGSGGGRKRVYVYKENKTGVHARVSFPGFRSSYRPSSGPSDRRSVFEQILSSLENHCFCSLEANWLDKLVKEGTSHLAPGEYRGFVERIIEKWRDAGSPQGLFIIRACQLGLCREGMVNKSADKGKVSGS